MLLEYLHKCIKNKSRLTIQGNKYPNGNIKISRVKFLKTHILKMASRKLTIYGTAQAKQTANRISTTTSQQKPVQVHLM